MAALLALCGLLVAAHLQHVHASALSAAPSPGFTLHDTANQEYAVPEGLLIGAGTSALQTEGAVSEGGRGESNVDHVLHDGKIFPGGPQHYHDTAADSYHRYKEDVAMAVALKLKLFRFSFSWTRLLPTANASEPNLEGVKHYHDVIKEITDNGLTPMVTLYHFDHPQILEDEFKGWMGEEMVDKFEEYARFVFNEYASEVKLWVTINEPNVYCTYFVLPDPQDPTKDLSKERFRCMRTNILAHAKAYKAFKDGKHEGLVGFSAHTINARPNSTSPEDVYAAEAFNQFQSGASLQPVVSGDYPQIVKDLAAGTVIPFSEEEKKLIKNTADFIGLNVYYSMVASYKHDQSDAGGEGGVPASIAPGKFGLEFLPFVSTVNDIKGDLAALYSENNPSALRTSLLWVWQSYKVPIFITENGFADIESLGLRDAPRAAYHSSYLRTLLKTIKDFNVKVLGYCAWSLIDAYEWSGVYSRRFGLVYVDYDGKLDRSLKDSKDFWIAMAENKVVPLVALSSASTQSVSLAALGAALAWLASRSS